MGFHSQLVSGVSVTQARSPCDFTTLFLLDTDGIVITSRPIAKELGLCHRSAAVRRVAKRRYKT